MSRQSRGFLLIYWARPCAGRCRAKVADNSRHNSFFCQYFFQKMLARIRDSLQDIIYGRFLGGGKSTYSDVKMWKILMKFSCHFTYILDTTLCRIGPRVISRVKPADFCKVRAYNGILEWNELIARAKPIPWTAVRGTVARLFI